jgi:hypothetical protein
MIGLLRPIHEHFVHFVLPTKDNRSCVDLVVVGGWDPLAPYSQMREMAPRLQRMALALGPVPLGGKTAIFVYLLAMHTALEANPETGILVFNPTIAWGLVDIPALTGKRHEDFPYEELSVQLKPAEDGLELDIQVVSKDRFLSPAAAELLAYAPLPEAPLGNARKVYMTGAAPNWLYAAYSRWLASSGIQEILAMDKGSQGYIRVSPPESASGTSASKPG